MKAHVRLFIGKHRFEACHGVKLTEQAW